MRLYRCSKCNQELPAVNFHQCSDNIANSRDGLHSYCKACRSQIDKRWREANREQKRVKDRQRYEENKDRALADRKRYYEENKDRVLAQCKLWREANLETKRAADKRWAAENPERKREHRARWRDANPEQCRVHYQNRRGRLHQLSGEFSAFLFECRCEEQDWECAYCATDLNPENVVIEHWTPLVRQGLHDIENIVASCALCNSRKNVKTGDEVLRTLALSLID